MNPETLQVVQFFITVIVVPILAFILKETVSIGKHIAELNIWREAHDRELVEIRRRVEKIERLE